MFQKLLEWFGGAATSENLCRSEALGCQGAGCVVVDVREQDEWKSGHINGAIHIPLGCLGTQLGRLARDAQIIAVRKSGGRSSRAVSILRGAGFEYVVNMRGGMTALERASLPVTTWADGHPRLAKPRCR